MIFVVTSFRTKCIVNVEKRVLANQSIMSSQHLQARLRELKSEFPSFLKNNNDFTHGRVVRIREANPGSKPYSNFCTRVNGRESMKMGIMFHGTHRDNIASICRDGIHPYSSFTGSLHYAVRRSGYKEGPVNTEVQVLAMAVLVDDASKFKRQDARLREPHYSLPLFVLTVSVS